MQKINKLLIKTQKKNTMKKLLAVLVLGVSMISCSTPDAPQETVQEVNPTPSTTTIEVITPDNYLWILGSNIECTSCLQGTSGYRFSSKLVSGERFIEVKKRVNGYFTYDSKAISSDVVCRAMKYNNVLYDRTWTFICKSPGIPDKKFIIRATETQYLPTYFIERIY